MTESVIDIVSWMCLVAGGLFGIVGGIGVLRLPDFFTRLHGAGLTDTLCAALILIGLMLQAGPTPVTVKLILILAFLFFTSPTATHALAKAALHGKLKPVLAAKESKRSNI
ncbi:MAG: monovalent cation/H(+) antiporter subunit G [Acidiferrobacterales bacterium]|jgi:multicomponent Na+:H+ antiporter subunit G